MRRIRTAVVEWFIDEIVFSTNKTFLLAAAAGGVAAVKQAPLGHPLALGITFAATVVADLAALMAGVLVGSTAEDAE